MRETALRLGVPRGVLRGWEKDNIKPNKARDVDALSEVLGLQLGMAEREMKA